MREETPIRERSLELGRSDVLCVGAFGRVVEKDAADQDLAFSFGEPADFGQTDGMIGPSREGDEEDYAGCDCDEAFELPNVSTGAYLQRFTTETHDEQPLPTR